MTPTIPHADPLDDTGYLHDPQTTIDDLRGNLALMELQLTMVYKFIDERLGLSREQTLKAINERAARYNCDRDHCTPEERAVIKTVCRWRKEGLEGAHEFYWRIDPMLDAVDTLLAVRARTE